MTRFALLLPLALWLAGGPARAESLFDGDTYRSLAADRKAFRVGDGLTVQVFENSSASSSADTATQRRNAISGIVTSVNPPRQYGGTLAVSGDFTGGGTTQRTNRVLAVLTVTVREVLPGGDLRVAGEQLLTVNQEQHHVSVEGRVRPQDVSTDNVVLSTRLADARITYVGEGDISERQRRAWWRTLLDWIGL
ncbi:MAG TPA: flagellar basal body L-ring protein FlgH [Anaeromyxobacter sp.]|jgi:flagellar L-ring protein precursor FlgH|nr:flagellar basal body L-ring protein FlgH [Anaeromyxobacter sp.]